MFNKRLWAGHWVAMSTGSHGLRTLRERIEAMVIIGMTVSWMGASEEDSPWPRAGQQDRALRSRALSPKTQEWAAQVMRVGLELTFQMDREDLRQTLGPGSERMEGRRK